MKQAKSIIEGISEGNNDDDDDANGKKIIGGGENSKKKRKKGGANVKENPLKKEIANPAGLDFANQVGALLAQPTKINMVPPADESRKSTQPEKIPFGVKTESKKVLEPKSNIFDINMQGRRSFTFECEGSFHNPRFYEAIVHFACKLVTAPVAGAGGGAAYQQYHIPAQNGEDAADSRYGHRAK